MFTTDLPSAGCLKGSAIPNRSRLTTALPASGLLVALLLTLPAQAYETARANTGQRLDFQSTTDVLSATASSASANGGTVTLNPVGAISSVGGASGPYTPAIATTTRAWAVLHYPTGCVVPGNGTTVNCGPKGTVTITFTRAVTNPVFHLSGLGAYWVETDGGGGIFYGTGFNTRLRLSASTRPAGYPVPQLALLNGNANFAVPAIDTVAPPSATPNISCDSRVPEGAGQPYAGCGSFRVAGTVSSVTFELSMQARMYANNVGQPSYTLGTNSDTDAFTMAVSLEEDFNDGAASYGSATQYASHLAGDLTIGSGISADNTAVANATSSPYTSPSDDADQFTWPTLARGAANTVSVPLSTASSAGTLCGWIDYDASGSYAAAEGDCTSFAAGATSANLVFTPPAGSPATRTARLRADYGSQLTTATWSGRADSGEVEDASLSLDTLADLSITKTDNTAVYTPGGTGSYVLHVCNSAGPSAASGVLISDPLPAGLTLTGPWTCAAAGGASCSAASGGSAGGTLVSLSADLPAGGCVDVTVPVRFSADSGGY